MFGDNSGDNAAHVCDENRSPRKADHGACTSNGRASGRNQVNTCKRSARDIVNPMTQMQFDPRLEVGSPEQEFWLIWLEHIIFFPAVYLMSLFGIGFGVYMWHKHGDKPA